MEEDEREVNDDCRSGEMDFRNRLFILCIKVRAKEVCVAYLSIRHSDLELRRIDAVIMPIYR